MYSEGCCSQIPMLSEDMCLTQRLCAWPGRMTVPGVSLLPGQPASSAHLLLSWLSLQCPGLSKTHMLSCCL